MKNQYVILTGSKNNAGDFLIKDRAKDLLTWLRPDRELIDKDGWRAFDSRALDEVNQSRALILMGGPALQRQMRPRVYALLENLEEIKVPIVTMGIGWYSPVGDWKSTHRYPLNRLSLELLQLIEKSGYLSSVRDYHTLNVLHNYGFKNYLMTGCPALYSQEQIGGEVRLGSEIRKVGFSLGVSLKSSMRMFRQMQDVVLRLRDVLYPAQVVVAFHHGLGDNYINSHSASKPLDVAQQRYRQWLEAVGVAYEDISGSAETLKQFYASCDLHVGYRVHAHIFMSSISKPSVLINEDGRGKALVQVLSGLFLDGYERTNNSLAVKICHKLKVPFDNFKPAEELVDDLDSSISYELEQGVRLSLPRKSIDKHFSIMKRFVSQLP